MKKFKVNDVVSNFVIDRVRQHDFLSGTVYEMTHKKTNAKLIYYDNNKSIKRFNLRFVTLPEDDTGVFHVIEHATLSGSDYFKVKNPLGVFRDYSLCSSANAYTGCSCTDYAAETTNDQDLFNAVEFFMKSVFYPEFRTNPFIFSKDAWHYEFGKNGRGLKYNGIVLNEIGENHYDPVDIIQTNQRKKLYKGTCYEYDFGGIPSELTKLTYEKFIKVYEENYHPSNTVIYLEGDVELERILERIDDLYSKFDRKEFNDDILKPNSLLGTRVEDTYPAENKGFAYLSCERVMCDYSDAVKKAALNILRGYLDGSDDAILSKPFNDRELADCVFLAVDNIGNYTSFAVVACDFDAEKESQLWDVIDKAKKDLIKDGFDKELLHSIIDKYADDWKENINNGFDYESLAMLDGWIYCNEPFAEMLDSEMIKKLHDLVDTTYYMDLLKELPLSPKLGSTCVVYPSNSNKKSKLMLKEDKRTIRAIKKDLGAKGIRKIKKENVEFMNWLTADDDPAEIAKIPKLSLDSLKRRNVAFYPSERQGNYLFHRIDNEDENSIRLYFSLTGIEEQYYPAVSLLIRIMVNCPYKTNKDKTESKLWKDLSFLIKFFESADDLSLVNSQLVVKFSVDGEDFATASKQIHDVLFEIDFDNPDFKKYLKHIIKDISESLKMDFYDETEDWLEDIALSHVSAGKYIKSLTNGVQCIEWLRNSFNEFDSNGDDLIEMLKRLRKKIFLSSSLIVSVASSHFDEKYADIGEVFNISNRNADPEYISVHFDQATKSEAVLTKGSVTCMVLVDNCVRYGIKPSPKFEIASRVLRDKYLWKKVRVIGGAYGCSCHCSRNGSVVLSSYADPNPLRTRKVFNEASSYIKAFCENEEDIGCFLMENLPCFDDFDDIKQEHSFADDLYFNKVSSENLQKEYDEILNITKEDLLECCDFFEKVAENGYLSISSSKHIFKKLKPQKIIDFNM